MTIITKSVRLVWGNPYVTDGLVSMWDAEWNDGPGHHLDDINRIRDFVGGHDLTFSAVREIAAKHLRVEPNNKTTIAGLDNLIASVPSDWTVEVVGNFNNSETVQRDTNIFAFNFAQRPVWGYVGGPPASRVGALTTPFGGFCLKSGREKGTSNTITSAGALYGNGGTRPLNTFSYFQEVENSILSQSGGFDATTARIYALRLYNRCLTAAEVTANYKVDVTRFRIG